MTMKSSATGRTAPAAYRRTSPPLDRLPPQKEPIEPGLGRLSLPRATLRCRVLGAWRTDKSVNRHGMPVNRSLFPVSNLRFSRMRFLWAGLQLCGVSQRFHPAHRSLGNAVRRFWLGSRSLDGDGRNLLPAFPWRPQLRPGTPGPAGRGRTARGAALPTVQTRWRVRWSRAGHAVPLMVFFRHWTAAAAVRQGIRVPVTVLEGCALGWGGKTAPVR